MEKPSIRSFVLRQGRMTVAQQEALEIHWPVYGLEIEDGPIDPETLFADLPLENPGHPLILDIGFGMGHALYDQAKANPDNCFIGVEVHGPGVGRMLHRAADSGLANLRIYKQDVWLVWDCIPDHCLDRIQVYFPDPWPKKRHHKRRLINREFLIRAAEKLRPSDGLLHLVTDWADYATHISMAVEAAACFKPATEVTRRYQTKYEKRALELGHQLFEFTYECAN